MRSKALFHQCALLISQSGDACDEGLGRAELQMEIKAYRHVVLIVGDIEVDDLLPLVSIIVAIHISELQTTVGTAIVTFYVHLTLITELSRIGLHTVNNREVDNKSFLPPCRIKGTCPHKNTHHIIDTLAERMLLMHAPTIMTEAVLLDVALPVRIGVVDLIHGIALAFPRPFAIIKRRHVERVIAEQRVAEHEEVVGFLVATRDKAALIGRQATEVSLVDVEGCRAHFHPYKLPVEIEVLGQALTRLECSVAERALRRS